MLTQAFCLFRYTTLQIFRRMMRGFPLFFFYHFPSPTFPLSCPPVLFLPDAHRSCFFFFLDPLFLLCKPLVSCVVSLNCIPVSLLRPLRYLISFGVFSAGSFSPETLVFSSKTSPPSEDTISGPFFKLHTFREYSTLQGYFFLGFF